MRYSLHITNNCNLRCAYCYEDNKLDPARKQFVISKEEIDQKIKQILSYGNCDELELLGGEVFLYTDKIKYLFERYHSNFKIMITTNATIRNECIDELIKTYKPILSVSLDDPLTVETQRVGLNFAKALANAKFWHKYTNVLIAAVINPQNIRRIKETFDFYIFEHGFKGIHFGCVEEWMNDHYWEIYKQEAVRLIESLDRKTLESISLSPWKYYAVHRKEIIFEDGIEKIEIFDTSKMELSKYREASYYVYTVCCAKLGVLPEPMIPRNVQLVETAA